MRTNLLERVLKTVKHYDMIAPGDSVLVTLSGGPDSVLLLHALVGLKGKLKLAKISVCHLDHGLRGEESAGDSVFAKRFAASLGLEFLHKKVDLRKKRSKDLSTEEEARLERYRFFVQAAAKAGANVIATGHTLDDQAETILMRIIKGASLKGIVGIAPVRQEGGLRIIRPLMQIEKHEIAGYLEANGIDYRVDRTNLEPIYFRNVVRGEILPFLEKYNPRLKHALFSLAEHLREDFDFIEQEKARARAHLRPTEDGKVAISLKDIVIQPKALQKEILRDALEKAGGEVKRLTFRHWKDLEHFIKYKRKGNSLDLPGSIRVSRTESALEFHLLPHPKRVAL